MNIKLKHTKFQSILEIITLLILIGMFVYVLLRWNEVPDQIPGHYNASGEIDRWGNKGELFILPFVSAGMYLFLSVIMFFPSAWNVPVTVTRENTNKVYGCILTMMILIKAELMANFLYLTYNGVEAKPLSPYYLIITLTAVFGTLIFFVIRLAIIAKKYK
jgi:uncharacterized membrane protein